mmetsp:Transcript_4506/g.10871  ORF Transcript_4506/g.10871 Transcript_4506/m.10871 type:complete len:113 (+) Transcript_4506:199-537(+)
MDIFTHVPAFRAGLQTTAPAQRQDWGGFANQTLRLNHTIRSSNKEWLALTFKRVQRDAVTMEEKVFAGGSLEAVHCALRLCEQQHSLFAIKPDNPTSSSIKIAGFGLAVNPH